VVLVGDGLWKKEMGSSETQKEGKKTLLLDSFRIGGQSPFGLLGGGVVRYYRRWAKIERKN